jgi:hypothetical protein
MLCILMLCFSYVLQLKYNVRDVKLSNEWV